MRLNGKEMKALVVLSVIVPIGILASLRLTGVLQGLATTAETKALEPVMWEFERPNRSLFVYIDEKLNATYTDAVLSSSFCVVIGEYIENSSIRGGYDYIGMAVKMNSTLTNPNAFIEGLNVVFGKDSKPSLVDWLQTSLNFKNLSLVEVTNGWTNGENYKEASVKLVGVGHPQKTCFEATSEWSLLTPNDQTHELELTCELTYFNGIAHKKVIQPFHLRIIGKMGE